eukprot:m.39971 g.39971  ORF g.39971 m.39971 type:complete len:357 (+) comp10236_c1_seq1:578-1648(+)
MTTIGKAQTVNGAVDPSTLGQVLMHEHILIDARPLGVPAPAHAPKDLNELKFDLASLGYIRQFPYSHQENLVCGEDEIALAELRYLRAAGCTTIVDVTTRGIGIDGSTRGAHRLQALATAADMHIVCGAGYYVGSTHPAILAAMSEEEIAAEITREVTHGMDGGTVKAGIIGEIGCSFPLKDSERRVLRAAARAQRATGAALMVHPGRDESAPLEIIDVLREAGAVLPRVIIAHIDRTVFTSAMLDALAATGVVLELDLFGNEVSYYQLDEARFMRSDEQRIEVVVGLLARGARVLLSHDIHTKHRMRSFGGHGYAYLFESIVPRLRTRGVGPDAITAMLSGWPQDLLTLVAPEAQ